MSRLFPALLSILLLAAACSKAPDPSGLPADINQALNPAFLAAFGHEAPAALRAADRLPPRARPGPRAG